MLGNWELALAAYNMGAGAVKRVKKQSKADFWMLADLELLSEQSILYVPKLIAITEAVENAEYYGAIDLGVDIIKSFVLQGIDITMNQYNKLGKK